MGRPHVEGGYATTRLALEMMDVCRRIAQLTDATVKDMFDGDGDYTTAALAQSEINVINTEVLAANAQIADKKLTDAEATLQRLNASRSEVLRQKENSHPKP